MQLGEPLEKPWYQGPGQLTQLGSERRVKSGESVQSGVKRSYAAATAPWGLTQIDQKTLFDGSEHLSDGVRQFQTICSISKRAFSLFHFKTSPERAHEHACVYTEDVPQAGV